MEDLGRGKERCDFYGLRWRGGGGCGGLGGNGEVFLKKGLRGVVERCFVGMHR